MSSIRIPLPEVVVIPLPHPDFYLGVAILYMGIGLAFMAFDIYLSKKIGTFEEEWNGKIIMGLFIMPFFWPIGVVLVLQGEKELRDRSIEELEEELEKKKEERDEE